ncbi:RIB43A-like with coiled-coils protein 2 [Echeneis naucrates]|uniref:RIB43A-like with coiled-coils protein 2 n=1 Tax=Echeneis naucrates TaxID=173247 RepID=UPI0011135856|nr:RIB43A-like with coiled-coils protein 1 [Echeneis naucrates]
MLQFELLSDRMKRESLQKRRDREAERRERVFNDKTRSIGVDKEALDMQVKEKKKQQEAEREREQACDADLCHNSKVAFILHSREEKKQRALEKDIVNYRLRHQQEYEPNPPDQEEAQMMPPGLVGLDLEMKNRQRRQKEQLRQWLLQQQSEQAAERQQETLKEQHYDQSRVEMDQKAQQLQRLEMERRKAEAIATKEYNLAITEQNRGNRHQTQGQVTDTDVQPNLGRVGVPGLFPSSDRRTPPESLQQVMEFQKYQIVERKRIELEKKQEEKLDDNARIASARMALLIERQQAKLSKQLRQHLDSTNVQLAKAHKQQKADIERGCIDDSFFSKFNTCSR